MKIKVILTLMFTTLTICSMAQEKEKRFEIKINGDVSFGTTKLSGVQLNTGIGLETILQYHFMPYSSLYEGWGGNNFNAEESFAGPDMDFKATGYIFGLLYKYPIKSSPVSHFVRTGFQYNNIKTENNEGNIVCDCGHEVGWQDAGGIEYDLGKNYCLNKGLKYNNLAGETKFDGNYYEFDHRYIALRIGVVKRF